jgi:transposase-like protein
MSGKRYTEEFKIAAVKQVIDRGHPAAEVAERLGVSIHRSTHGQSATACQTPSAKLRMPNQTKCGD